MKFGAMIMTNWRELLAEATVLDESNFHALYLVDHPVMDVPDAWAYLAYLAGRTQRIRLGTHVICAPLHHPANLAKQIATVDVLSNGRAVLGIGAGYNVHDFEPYGHKNGGLKWRLDLLEETVQIVKALWTRDDFTFDGRCFQLRGGAHISPKPIQQPHPPILVAGNTPRRLAKIGAAHADGWNTWQLGPAQIREVKAALDAQCRAIGRDPASLQMTADVLMIRGGTREAADQLARDLVDYARGAGRGHQATQWNASGVLYGDEHAMAEQIARFAEVGVEELTISAGELKDVLWFSERVIPKCRTS
jgi:probable F420-dependent oxidoreductase